MNVEAKAGPFARGLSRLKALVNETGDEVVRFGKSLEKLGKDDPRRVIHSIKVGLAVSLVSLLYYVRPLYNGYGISGMWAVLTVVVVFEFTVGGTLSRCINRGCATLAAAALGVGAQRLASEFDEVARPFVVGVLVFFLAAIATFTRFFPRIKARYDYGVLIFILTFTMVSISGYRTEELLELARQRSLTILTGGAICVVVSTCFGPVWAGEDLHNMTALHLEKLAIYIEGFEEFGSAYFECEGRGKTCTLKEDRASMHGYKGIVVSKTTEEILANFARWEPCHGQFQFRHPWEKYLKIGSLARKCAFQIEALDGYVYSNVQVPAAFKEKIKDSCVNISSELSKALNILSQSIKSIADPSPTNIHLKKSMIAVEELESTLKAMLLEDCSDLLGITPAAVVISILTEVTNCVQCISEAVHELVQAARFEGTKKSSFPSDHAPPTFLHSSVATLVDGKDCKVTVTTVV